MKRRSPRSVDFKVASFLVLCALFASLTLPVSHAYSNEADADQADYLSPLENEIIREMNLARTEPHKYASYLEQYKQRYVGAQYKSSKGHSINTVEGIKAVDEAIRFLKAAKALPPLKVSKGLSMGAKDHVRDLLLKGQSGHRGSDGSSTEQRVNRYGDWMDKIGENIAYDGNSAREVVIGWIIDDGVKTRGHRMNIFNPLHRIAGVAAGDGAKRETLCVTTFAGGFTERNDKGKPAVLRRF